MLTQINTYEGVPVGSANFEDFLEYVRGFLGANFGFSTNVLANSGGYFADDDFVFSTFGSSSSQSTQMYAFLPQTKDFGSLFGELDNEYYRFETLGPSSATPQVYEWELLPTNGNEISTGYRFQNVDFTNKSLPYNPINLTDTLASYGYNYISYNGVEQNSSNYSVNFSIPGSGQFREQNIDVVKINVGAESPRPVNSSGRFNGGLGYSQGSGITHAELSSEFNNRLEFPYTNFSLGGHIVLTRSVGLENYYVYLPEDTSSGEEVASGTYKVINKSRGIIEVDITQNQLNSLVDDSETFADILTEMDFFVVSVEQLLVDRQGSVTNYRTRYGDVYDGEDSEVLLARLVFDGDVYQITEIDSTNYVSSSGSNLLQDNTGQYDDSTILAFRYDTLPDLTSYRSAQQNRYVPDTFQLFFHSGILVSDVGGSQNQIRSFVEQNPSSWYNQKSANAQYYPVNRGMSTYVSYITAAEAGNFSSDISTFTPTETFRIVDTISLKALSDVYGPLGSTQFDVYYGVNPSGVDDTILKFDSATGNFIARKHILSELNDVGTTPPNPGQVLTYNGTNWVPQSLSGGGGVLGYDALNRAGDTLYAGGRLRYTDNMPSSGTYDNNILTNVEYVDGSLSDHNSTTNVHDARSTATASRIVIRDSSARAAFANPASATDTSQNAATANWINTVASTTGPTANRIARRDSSGRLEAADPSTQIAGSNGNSDVVTANWMFDWSSTGADADHLIRRDGSGRAQVQNPSASLDIANKSYVDSQISANSIPQSSGSGPCQGISHISRTYTGSWISVGHLFIVEGIVDTNGDEPHFRGPQLPSGTYSVITAWGIMKFTSNTTGEISLHQGNMYRFDSGTRRPEIEFRTSRTGSVYATWIVRKTS